MLEVCFDLYYRFSLDPQWSKVNIKRTVATAGEIFAVIGLLCLPLIRITFLIFTFVLLNMSLRIRRFYVQILAIVFDYATKIKKDKEYIIDVDQKQIESSTPSENAHTQCEHNANGMHSRKLRSSSDNRIRFNLGRLLLIFMFDEYQLNLLF